MKIKTFPTRVVGAALGLCLLIGGLATAPTTPTFAAEGIGTGAVSIKGPQSELIPGVTVEIRKDSCSGAPVWYTTTGSSPQAYGAFGIGLAPGTYCIVTLAVPANYNMPGIVTFTMEQRPANWVTVWVPESSTVTGALVAKDPGGKGIDGVTAFIQVGECGASGQGVWRNTTATSRWSVGGFGIAVGTGPYCVTTEAVPSGYALPAPFTVNVTNPSPFWITVWVAPKPISGNGDSVVPVAFGSAEKIISFSCPSCTGNTIVWAHDAHGPSELLVNEIGPYAGRRLVGMTDWTWTDYTMLEVQTTGSWTLEIQDLSRARSVTNRAVGAGDDVVAFTSSGTAANISNTGNRNFIVWSSDAMGEVDLLVNEIGNYWGTRPVRSPSLMQVLSDGSWEISVG